METKVMEGLMVLKSSNDRTERGPWGHLIQLYTRRNQGVKDIRDIKVKETMDRDSPATDSVGNKVSKMSVTISLGEVKRASMMLSIKTSI